VTSVSNSVVSLSNAPTDRADLAMQMTSDHAGLITSGVDLWQITISHEYTTANHHIRQVTSFSLISSRYQSHVRSQADIKLISDHF